MSYATLDALRSSLGAVDRGPAYDAKMMHPVPDAPTVHRHEWILERCQGKRVLDFGASGVLHDAMTRLCPVVVGVDREGSEGIIAFDLDDVSQPALPADTLPDPDVIVCGEVLEHLSNPGHFLTRLRRQFPCPVIISVPNAFSQIARAHLKTSGRENVNADHVCWFSYHTLRVLLGRTGYSIRELAWYNGPAYFAEGLIVVTE